MTLIATTKYQYIFFAKTYLASEIDAVSVCVLLLFLIIFNTNWLFVFSSRSLNIFRIALI